MVTKFWRRFVIAADLGIADIVVWMTLWCESSGDGQLGTASPCPTSCFLAGLTWESMMGEASPVGHQLIRHLPMWAKFPNTSNGLMYM